MTLVVGLTGSIGMGKTTTAQMFADAGVPVWDADDAVRRLYGAGGAAVADVGTLCPEAVRGGAVDRAALTRWIGADPTALGRLEAVVHPLVAADRRAFIADTDAEIVLLDIPLLFETGGEAEVDRVVVVSAPAEVQRARVLGRQGMTRDTFERLVAKQTPDAEKRRRADYVIETTSLEDARASVHKILRDLRGQRDA